MEKGNTLSQGGKFSSVFGLMVKFRRSLINDAINFSLLANLTKFTLNITSAQFISSCFWTTQFPFRFLGTSSAYLFILSGLTLQNLRIYCIFFTHPTAPSFSVFAISVLILLFQQLRWFGSSIHAVSIIDFWEMRFDITLAFFSISLSIYSNLPQVFDAFFLAFICHQFFPLFIFFITRGY